MYRGGALCLLAVGATAVVRPGRGSGKQINASKPAQGLLDKRALGSDNRQGTQLSAFQQYTQGPQTASKTHSTADIERIAPQTVTKMSRTPSYHYPQQQQQFAHNGSQSGTDPILSESAKSAASPVRRGVAFVTGPVYILMWATWLPVRVAYAWLTLMAETIYTLLSAAGHLVVGVAKVLIPTLFLVLGMAAYQNKGDLAYISREVLKNWGILSSTARGLNLSVCDGIHDSACIQKAFRQFAIVNHPDKNGGVPRGDYFRVHNGAQLLKDPANLALQSIWFALKPVLMCPIWLAVPVAYLLLAVVADIWRPHPGGGRRSRGGVHKSKTPAALVNGSPRPVHAHPVGRPGLGSADDMYPSANQYYPSPSDYPSERFVDDDFTQQ